MEEGIGETKKRNGRRRDERKKVATGRKGRNREEIETNGKRTKGREE